MKSLSLNLPQLYGLPRLYIPAVLVICLGLVIYGVLQHSVGDYGVETDFYLFYAPTAQALQQGHIVIDDYHPPLYGWLLGILDMTGLFSDMFVAALLVSLISYVAIVAAVFGIARSLFEDAGVALLAAGLTATNPVLLDHAFRANVHPFFLAVSLSTMHFALRRQAVSAGFFAALAIWTRYMLPLSLAPLFFLPRKKLIPALAIALAAWVALGLVTLETRGGWCQNLNKINIAAGLYNLEYETNAGMWAAKYRSEFEHKNYIDILLYKPQAILPSIWKHVSQFSGKLVSEVMVFPLGFIGLFGLRRRFWPRWVNPLTVWTAIMFGVLLVAFWGDQFAINFVPLLSVAAAAQLAAIRVPRLDDYLLPAALALPLLVGGAKLVSKAYHGPVDVKEAALFLKGEPGTTVLAKDPRVFYYSGKQPGKVKINGDKISLDADYVLNSPYEQMVNDDVKRLIATPTFRERTQAKRFGNAVQVIRDKPDLQHEGITEAEVKSP